MPRLPKKTCPTITNMVKIQIGIRYSINKSGCIIIPTETKNMAANRSFTGFTNFSIFSASIVYANNDPMTKAPSAEENPALVEIITIPRQNPNAMINKVSSLRNGLTFFRKLGIR